ncbi:MAG TPA: hypothetical protein PLT66_07930 [Bacillota bacterium]|nr:hypothetical protein [Bacillota bacterium]
MKKGKKKKPSLEDSFRLQENALRRGRNGVMFPTKQNYSLSDDMFIENAADPMAADAKYEREENDIPARDDDG